MTTRGATWFTPPAALREGSWSPGFSILPTLPHSGQAPFYDKRAAVLGKLGFETGGSVDGDRLSESRV